MTIRSASILATIAVAAPTARAGFIDATVAADYRFVYEGVSYVQGSGEAQVTNDATPEFVGFSGTSPTFDIDLTDDTIKVFHFDGADRFDVDDFNGLVFTDPNASIASFTSVTLDGTSMAGFDATRISFDADRINLDWNGLAFDPDTFIMLRVGFADDTPSQPVPDPTALPAGVAVLSLALRSRRPRATR